MTANPTLTWAFSSPATFAIAGANPTVAEMLLGLKNHITSFSTWWTVSDYNAGNGTLEIKRNATGSPTGELATVRILFFGGSSPNAGALSLLHTAGNTTTLYAGLSVDANTTGPSASYTAGAPYSTKYARAGAIVITTGLSATNTPKISLFETVDTFGFSLSDSLNMSTYCGGRMIIRAKDDSLAWGNMPSGGHAVLSTSTDNLGTLAAAFAMPNTDTGASITGKCNYWDVDTASSRLFGRVMAPSLYTATSQNLLGASGSAAQLLRVPILERAAVGGSTTTYLGELRQIRFGPSTAHLNKIKDASNVLQGTYISGGTAVSYSGLWCGEIP